MNKKSDENALPKWKPMLLYHGTTADAADRMKTEGIKPRCQLAQGSQWKDAPSRYDCVYLTSDYGGQYAMQLLAQSKAGRRREVAVIEIDSSQLDPSLLLADE